MAAISAADVRRSDRTRQISIVLWTILALNWFVALLKLIVGHRTQSISIFADGLHSFSDGASNIIGLVGISIARRPADFDHHYGHQKYETLASAAIAFLLFFVSFQIGRGAVQGFLSGRSPQVSWTAFVLMAGTLIVNLFVAAYERRRARELGSELLHADSWHTMTDVFVTLSVLVALAASKFGVRGLDAAFAFGIAVLIAAIAVRLLKLSSDVLSDRAPLDPAQVDAVVRRVPGVRDCHEIRTRGKPQEVYVDLHVLVDNEMTVLESHRLANIIERDIQRELSGVHDVVVHIEPASHEHGEN